MPPSVDSTQLEVTSTNHSGGGLGGAGAAEGVADGGVTRAVLGLGAGEHARPNVHRTTDGTSCFTAKTSCLAAYVREIVVQPLVTQSYLHNISPLGSKTLQYVSAVLHRPAHVLQWIQASSAR